MKILTLIIIIIDKNVLHILIFTIKIKLPIVFKNTSRGVTDDVKQ